MDFPRYVFQATNGKSTTLLVADITEYDAAIRAGWYSTVIDALETKPEVAQDELDLDAPPTRAELEQMARELGIKFDGRTGDRALLKRINDALEG